MEGDVERLAGVTRLLQTVETAEPPALAMAVMSEVAPGILLGNRFLARNQAMLEEMGVTHVLNAAHPGPEGAMSVDCGGLDTDRIGYLGLPLADTTSQDILSSFSKAGGWLAAALEQEGARVLICCWAGLSRSAAVLIAFMMEYRGHSLERAVREVKAVRNIKPNRGFLIQLVRYERLLGRRV
jgi:atypical dual specificity phosphatase